MKHQARSFFAEVWDDLVVSAGRPKEIYDVSRLESDVSGNFKAGLR